MDLNNGTVIVDDREFLEDNNEYYGILIVAAIFFAVFALASSVYMRQRRIRLENYSGSDTVSNVITSSRRGHSRRLSPRRERPRGLQALDVGRLAPPPYDDLPPSYEDSIKQDGIINLGFSSEPGVQELPPPYVLTEGALNIPSTSSLPSGVETSSLPSRVETSVQTLGDAELSQSSSAVQPLDGATNFRPTVGATHVVPLGGAVTSLVVENGDDSRVQSEELSSDEESTMTYWTCPTDSPVVRVTHTDVTL